MVLRLCVPLIHRLVARNWNFASSGLALTASSVANRVGVSTPLSAGRGLVVVVIVISLVRPLRPRGGSAATAPEAGDGGDARRRAFPRPSATFPGLPPGPGPRPRR